MKLTIQALGWIIKILWFVTLVFPLTIGLSLMEFAGSEAVGFGEPSSSFSEGQFCFSLPVFVDNKGFYDFSDINVTVYVEAKGKDFMQISRTFPVVHAHSRWNGSYDLNFSLSDVVSRNRALLFEDLNISLKVSIFFKVAYLIGFGIETNMSMPWGAPFYNFSLISVRYDSASESFVVLLSFKNQAPFSFDGLLSIMLLNEEGEVLGSDDRFIDVSSGSFLQELFNIPVEDPSKVTENGFVSIRFEGIEIFRWKSNFGS